LQKVLGRRRPDALRNRGVRKHALQIGYAAGRVLRLPDVTP
jgi:hypothetical protein